MLPPVTVGGEFVVAVGTTPTARADGLVKPVSGFAGNVSRLGAHLQRVRGPVLGAHASEAL